MNSPYLPIFDQTLKMSRDDCRRIGFTTATLLVRQQEWLHRRVELVTFEDQDIIRRSNSVDFTIPPWVFRYLDLNDSDQFAVAVPLALFRKGTLVHFNLNDEGSAAVPLLSTQQTGPLAEMALLATAELILHTDKLPSSIVDDIREVACEGPDEAIRACGRLFSQKRTNPAMRASLKAAFSPLATCQSRPSSPTNVI
jgi:hypothetical protein